MHKQDRKSRWGWKTLSHLCKGLATVILILLLALVGIGQVAKLRLGSNFPPPGEMVDVGGYKLHIDCVGAGEPTVIFEAGLGDFSSVWKLVQDKLANNVRACAYDRAGMGWSDRSPSARTVTGIANDLHTLLKNAGIPGPYVLVGHSMGGLYVRKFASLYPDEVVGMVLVDAVHEEQLLRMPESYRKADAKLASQSIKTLNLLRSMNELGVLALFPALIPVAHPELPVSVQMASRSVVLSDSRYFETLIEDYQLYQNRLQQGGEDSPGMKDVPLIIITHGYPQRPLEAMGMTKIALQEYEPIWQEMQLELSKLSSQGELRIADKSDHYIHLKQPKIVVNSINDILQVLHGREL